MQWNGSLVLGSNFYSMKCGLFEGGPGADCRVSDEGSLYSADSCLSGRTREALLLLMSSRFAAFNEYHHIVILYDAGAYVSDHGENSGIIGRHHL